jgi:hypothetical protein
MGRILARRLRDIAGGIAAVRVGSLDIGAATALRVQGIETRAGRTP